MNKKIIKITLGIVLINSILMFLTVNSFIGLNGLNVSINTITLLISGILLLVINKLKITELKIIDIVFYLFILFGVISSLVHAEIYILFRFTFYLLLYFVFVKIIPTFNNQFENNKILGNTVILIFGLVLISPYIIPNEILSYFYYYEYRGLFNNPNSLGIASVTFLIILLSKFLYHIDKNEKVKAMLITLMFVLGYLTLIGASSRASFISANIIIVCFALIKIFHSYIYRLKNIIVLSVISIIIILILLIYSESIYSFLFENVLYKFEQKSGDQFDGRSFIWSKIISESNLLGNGKEYVDNLVIAPHNTFLYFVAESGWITASLLLLFVLILFIKSISFYFNSASYFKELPFLIIFSFLTLSIAENIYLQAVTYLLFYQAGILYTKKT